jgi:phospholipid/cholesterol/gamma-HCH transport system substrate-binding protein
MKRRNEVSVGILITAAVVVLLLGTLWLLHGALKSGYPLHTRFSWGQNLKQGQPVLLAGVSVGYVGDVTLRRDGYLDVLLRIEDQYPIPKGSTATVKAIGIFGDVAVALTPPIPVPRNSYSPNDTVPPGPPAADFDQILSRVDSIGTSVQLLAKAIQVQVVEAGTLKDIGRIVASTAQASAELRGVILEQNKNLSATMAAFRESATHIGHIVDSAQVAASIDSLRQVAANGNRLLAHLDSTNSKFQTLLAQVQNPNGTIGKFLTDSMLYTDLRHTVQQTDSLLADFKKNPKKYINLRIF